VSQAFLFLNSGTPLALEDGNSKNCGGLNVLYSMRHFSINVFRFFQGIEYFSV